MRNLQLSERIKARCKEKQITIKALLEACGMNRNTIYDLERKGAFPSADKLARIADYLDCSVDYLLGETDEKKPPAKAGGAEDDEDVAEFAKILDELSDEQVQKVLEYMKFLRQQQNP